MGLLLSQSGEQAPENLHDAPVSRIGSCERSVPCPQVSAEGARQPQPERASKGAPQPKSPAPAPSLYDNPGLQSLSDEPEILVPTRRPGGGIHFVALKR
jgi:hypothetical protein